MNIGTLDGYVFCNRLTRNAAHDVNAEFQSLAVNVVSNRFEAFSVCGGRENDLGEGIRRPYSSMQSSAKA